MDVVAHRGLWGASPENSLAAFDAAVRAGVGHVECDVRAARDGTPFILHDATLDRTTQLGGRLSSVVAADARRARLADGSPLPRIEEALDLCAGRAVLCIDVKERAVAPAVLRLLRNAADVEVWCHDTAVVRAAADFGVRAALISTGLLRRGIGDLIWHAWDVSAAALSFYPADLEPHVAAACRNAGMPFLCGAPNDAPTWRRLDEAGARGIITDRPLACRAFLSHRGTSMPVPIRRAPAADAWDAPLVRAALS